MALNLLHQVSMDLLYFLTHGDLLCEFVNMSQTVITSAESKHEENSLSSVNEDQKISIHQAKIAAEISHPTLAMFETEPERN